MNTNEFAAWLNAQLGKPYVWGANGPDKFDCSGMVYCGYNASGNVRSDTTAAGLYKRTVATNSPRLGDLAFLYSGGYIAHVGIMLDSDTVIEARGHAYGVVKTKLNTFKNRSGYTWKGVRRDTAFHLEQTPIVEESTATFFKVGFCAQKNHRFGGLPSNDPRRIAKLKSAMNGIDIFGVTECDSIMQLAILAAFPGYDSKRLSTGTIVVFFNHDWIPRTTREVLHGSNYHGALCVPFVNVKSKEGFDFIIGHTRPASIASAADKRDDLIRTRELAGTWPVVIGGDLGRTSDDILAKGFARLTPKVDTYDDNGVQCNDVLYGGFGIDRNYGCTKIDSDVSDHSWWRIKIKIGE